MSYFSDISPLGPRVLSSNPGGTMTEVRCHVLFLSVFGIELGFRNERKRVFAMWENGYLTPLKIQNLPEPLSRPTSPGSPPPPPHYLLPANSSPRPLPPPSPIPTYCKNAHFARAASAFYSSRAGFDTVSWPIMLPYMHLKLKTTVRTINNLLLTTPSQYMHSAPIMGTVPNISVLKYFNLQIRTFRRLAVRRIFRGELYL